MLLPFSIRLQNRKSGQLYIMSVMAVDMEMALCMASHVTAKNKDLEVLGF